MNKTSFPNTDMRSAEIMIRRGMSCNVPADRAEALTSLWIRMDDNLRDQFVLGLISRVAMMPREDA